MIELRNLARIYEHPEHMALMRWCLTLHRRVLRIDRQGAYGEMRQLFPNMQASDEAWLNMFQVTSPLGSQAAPRDRAFQLFQTIDGVGEGCFKPQLQIIYAFAYREAMGKWPTKTGAQGFGKMVADFPEPRQSAPPIFLHDPILNIQVNQWRNIAAHKSFSLVGPQTIEVKYGNGGKQKSRKLGLHRLRKVSSWLIKTHNAVRLANTITFVEHIQEIFSQGQTNIERPISASILNIAHDLSTVGFNTVEWIVIKREGVLSVVDQLDRNPREALIHASQQLVQLAVGVLADVATSSRISKVSIQLLLPDGRVFAKARAAVTDADAFSLRKIHLNKYMDRIEWIVDPNK